MSDEIRLHLELQAERNIAGGMDPDEARYAARRQFGGVEQIKERCRDQRRWVWLEQWSADVRFALRSLNRAPGFATAVVAALVLGIGSAAVVFNLSIGALFQVAPYTDPQELLAIGYKDKLASFGPDISGLQFLAYQEQTTAFVGYAAIEGRIANVVIDHDPVPANYVAISVDGFATLGITPALGRLFRPEEFHEAANQVVVVTDALWRKRLNADPSVLGREILIDQQPCKVIGVLRPGQTIPFRFQGEVYRPLVFTLSPQNRFGPGIHVVGRLRPGVSAGQAGVALATVHYPTLSPEETKLLLADKEPAVVPINAVNARTIWWVLMAGGVFLFAIACMNAMNLMLVRLLGRTRELGIRLAMGCTGTRIARLLLIESAALTGSAGVIVLLIAGWWFQPLLAALWGNPTIEFEVFGDWMTAGSVATLCVVATLAISLVPICWVSKTNANESLKSGGAAAGETPGIGLVRNALVILQAALAVLLLVGTGLMMQTVQRLEAVDLGFDPAKTVKVWLVFPPGFEPQPEAKFEYFERLRQRVAKVPGVEQVAFGDDALLVGAFWGWVNLPMKDGTAKPVAMNFLSAGYGNTAGMHVKRGRWFSGRRDEWEVVINETLARAHFGGDDPIGQSFKFNPDAPACRVVGVVGDVRENLRAPAGLRLYLPAWIAPWNLRALVLHTVREPQREIKGVIRRAIYDFDPTVITNYVGPMREVVADAMGTERFAWLVLCGLAVIALALAVLGLSTVMVYSVRARGREFAVRMALGADSADIQSLVLTRGVATAGAGLLIGMLAAFCLTRFMQSLLFETAPYDPVVYAAATGVLLGAAVVASWLPARRAAKVDPMVALRCE